MKLGLGRAGTLLGFLFLWMLSGRAPAEEAQAKPAAEAKPAESDGSKKKAKKEKKKNKKNGKTPIVEPDPEYAKVVEATRAQAEVELKERIQKNIYRLSTSAYKEAEAELIKIGKPAVPYLIDALEPAEKPVAGEAPLEAYVLYETGRATRQRSLSEVAYEVLDSWVRNRTPYQGEPPGPDKKAWQKFWTSTGETLEWEHKP